MPTDSQTGETPVLIIGGGPVGLALASDLGNHGVPCIVVEQNDATTDHPKASALNARSMEFMRRLGIADEVRDAAMPPGFPHTVLYCTTLTGYEIARIERPGHGGNKPSPISPERAQRCNQLWLDPILRKLAQSKPTADLRYRCRFETLTEHDGYVEAEVRDLTNDKVLTIKAQYVVDCSGGHSPVRRQLGIEMLGSDHTGYNLSVLVRAPDLWTYHDKGKAALITFVDVTGAWRNLVLLDGGTLYRFGVRGKKFYNDPDNADLDRFFNEVVGREVPHEILSVRRWTARNVVAEKYQTKRIFLAGDAAHLNHPAGGFGLNTGLGDAIDLGWKLHATLAGWGGPELLASYQAERRPVGVRNVSHADVSNADDRKRPSHTEIAADTPAGAQARSEMQAAILKTQTRKVITDGIALGYRYNPSPLICDDNSPAPEYTVSDYHPTTCPGARAPHAILPDGRSTLDLFGESFVLMRFGSEAPEANALIETFAARNIPLNVIEISDPGICKLYERRLVLVRPDGHVCWRSNDPPDKPNSVAAHVTGNA